MFKGFFEKLKDGLTKTRDDLTEKVNSILKSNVKIDEDLYEELEEILITCDIGVNTSVYLIEKLREKIKEEKIKDVAEVKPALKRVISELLKSSESSIKDIENSDVLLVVGVNGVGKTTSIGKLSNLYRKSGKKVLLAAADTFRAGAIDQLEVWSKRANVDIVKHQEGADPAAVVFDAIQASKARKVDLLICDTAGRLHNKKNLMNELEKINRIIEKEYAGKTKKCFLVLDATMGQNAVIQAKQFKEVCNVDGIILTKLDGTAKGGVVISIYHELQMPVKYIGVGEQMDDLDEFVVDDFIEALF